jgi:hypothetical protein
VSEQQPSQRPGWLTLVIDVVSLTFPWVLIFKQAGIIFTPPTSVSEPILWLAGAMLGVPGVAQILALRFGGTTGPQQQPGAPPDSSSGPSSISTSPADAA